MESGTRRQSILEIARQSSPQAQNAPNAVRSTASGSQKLRSTASGAQIARSTASGASSHAKAGRKPSASATQAGENRSSASSAGASGKTSPKSARLVTDAVPAASGNPSIWERMRFRWLDRLRLVDEYGDLTDCIKRREGAAFGLGCTVCASASASGVIKRTRWATFSYGSEPPKHTAKRTASMQLEDLLRHCNLSQAQAKGKAPLDRSHAVALEYMKCKHHAAPVKTALLPDDDSEEVAPTNDQIKIALELCWGWCPHYFITIACPRARCADARVPHPCPRARCAGARVPNPCPRTRCGDARVPAYKEIGTFRSTKAHIQ